MSTYFSVLFAVKYFHIFVFSVRLNLSTIDALVSLYVVKSVVACGGGRLAVAQKSDFHWLYLTMAFVFITMNCFVL
jgi:hypothetical protein